MPKVIFKKDNLVVEVPEGKRLLEVCMENNTTEPQFSCENGICGTCLSSFDKVENLEPKTPTGNEAERLRTFFAKPNERLACQVKVKGDIVIKRSDINL